MQKNLLALAVVLMAAATGICQTKHFSKEVIIVSGGKFSSPTNLVKVAYYNADSAKYVEFDSIPGASTSDVIIDSGFAYVAADSVVVKYNLINHTRVATGSVPGVQSLATYKNYILATRYIDEYVYVLNKSDLTKAFAISGIPDQSRGIAVRGDSAYVAVPGPYFKDTGLIAVIDLTTMNFSRTIFLDSLGSGIHKVYSAGNKIYAISERRSVITTIDSTGKDTSVLQKLNFIANGTGITGDTLFADIDYIALGSYNLKTNKISNYAIVDYTSIPAVMNFTGFVAGSVYDTVRKRFYVTVTDYNSYGECYVFARNGKLLDSFRTGVSPEALAVLYGDNTGLNKDDQPYQKLTIFPNPATESFYFVSGYTKGNLTVSTVEGKTVISENALKPGLNRVEIESLKPGIYLVSLSTESGISYSKLVKE